VAPVFFCGVDAHTLLDLCVRTVPMGNETSWAGNLEQEYIDNTQYDLILPPLLRYKQHNACNKRMIFNHFTEMPQAAGLKCFGHCFKLNTK
jgi:hypothetical protein